MERTLKFFGIITGRGLAITLLMAAPFSPAVAAEMSCDQLAKILAQTGENPAISINTAKETVTLRTSRGFCTEGIDAWSKRPAVSSKADKKPAVQSKPEPAPKQVAPVPVLESPPAAPSCRYQVGDVWGSMTVNIEGVDHWLVRAFTMDLDGDRIIDNVNFKFQAKNKSTRELQYFGVPGEIPGNAYPVLKLRDESVIRYLCFGQQKYKMPDFFGDKKERVLFGVHKPDLAGEKDARDRGVTYVRPSTKKQKPKEEETSWWVWLAGSLGLLMLLGGSGFWFYRQRAKAKDGDEAGDDDEDGDKMGDDVEDEDDEGKPEKKKGLGGLLDRLKKKKKKKSPDANEDEDADDRGDDEEAEAEDGEGKPEKKKKGLGGLLSLFKRKKKKKAADKDEDDDGDEGGKKD